MATLLTFTWSASSNPALAATVTGRVLRLTPGAGVTGRVALQVTNNTDADLLVNDSGAPAADAASAKFVIPPRCTATHPLDAAGQVTFTWTGGVIGTADYVDAVFTDDPLTSAVWPGVIPSAGSSAPIGRYSVTKDDTGITPSTFINTPSGRNIGNLFIYNNTDSGVDVIQWLPGPPPAPNYIAYVPAYSWVTLPLNLPSGQVSIQSAAVAGWGNSESLYVAWSDVNYVGSFPAGAGSLPNPISSAVARAQRDATRQFSWAMEATGPSNPVIGTLPAFVTQQTRVVIEYVGLDLVAGAAAAKAVVQIANGIDGLATGVPFVLATLRATAGTYLSTTMQRSRFVTNLSAVNVNSFTLNAAGSPVSASVVIHGVTL